LRIQIQAALQDGRQAAAEQAQQEVDAVLAELARAFGLGERRRITGSPAEKARLNVTRALRAAIARLSEALPEPGRVLDARVRTGLYCAYLPAESDEIHWAFSPD
jgi:hypothetical protein